MLIGTKLSKGDQSMTSVALYSEQPILTAGLQAAMAGLEDIGLSAIFTDLDPLIDHVRTNRPSVTLVEVTAAVTMATLSKLEPMAGNTPMVLWVDVISVELVSQALAVGVRGILRKSLPVELQIKCLRTVAAGDLWVEQALCDQILTARRIVTTRRERHVMSLLSQGLKNKEIAHATGLSEGTVKVYLTRLFQKVGVHDRLELALFALGNSFADEVPELEPVAWHVPNRPAVHPGVHFPQPVELPAIRAWRQQASVRPN
jgi:two-component system, NarL family, nitrate/nitrite response regulator NarL